MSLTPEAATSESAPDELDVLQEEIDLHRAQLAGLEVEAREAGIQLGEIAHLASQLKIRISEGDSNATAGLDALEREELAIRRVRDGLTLRIQSLQSDLAPRLARAVELAQARDAIRQDRAIEELTANATAMTEELLSAWRNACAIGFNLMTLLDGAMAGGVNLDSEHKRQVLILNGAISKQIFQASLEQVNQRWSFARADSFHQLKVLPGKPRTDVARAS